VISDADRTHLIALLREAGLERLVEKLDYVVQRLEQCCFEYNARAHDINEGGIPSTVSVSEVLSQSDGDPLRVTTLLQALAFACTPTMLAMMWMVEMGAVIGEVSLEFKRRESLNLKVALSVGLGDTTVTFESSDLWDLSLFRFVGLVKGDELPIITGMFPTPLYQ
jgi:hypothetical protein